jgi:hypothetical protein
MDEQQEAAFQQMKTWSTRPTGATRRSMRMQQDWDKQYEIIQAEQEAARRAERERLGYELQLRQENRMQTSQDLAMESARLKEEREARVQDEAKMIFDSIRGKNLPDGTVIPPLRPNDPNALERVTNLMNMTYGMESQPAKEAVMMLYNDIIKSEEGRQKESQAEEAWLVKQQEEASKLGIDTAKFIEVDPETKRMNIDQLGMAKEIGLARRKEAEDRQKQIAQSKLDEETRSQASSVLDDINKLDSEIRKENFSASRQKNSTLRQGHIDNVDFLTSEREVLVNRFNSLMPQRPQEAAAKFDSVEAAEAANLPKGTIVEINGRRARID